MQLVNFTTNSSRFFVILDSFRDQFSAAGDAVAYVCCWLPLLIDPHSQSDRGYTGTYVFLSLQYYKYLSVCQYYVQYVFIIWLHSQPPAEITLLYYESALFLAAAAAHSSSAASSSAHTAADCFFEINHFFKFDILSLPTKIRRWIPARHHNQETNATVFEL